MRAGDGERAVRAAHGSCAGRAVAPVDRRIEVAGKIAHVAVGEIRHHPVNCRGQQPVGSNRSNRKRLRLPGEHISIVDRDGRSPQNEGGTQWKLEVRVGDARESCGPRITALVGIGVGAGHPKYVVRLEGADIGNYAFLVNADRSRRGRAIAPIDGRAPVGRHVAQEVSGVAEHCSRARERHAFDCRPNFERTVCAGTSCAGSVVIQRHHDGNLVRKFARKPEIDMRAGDGE